MRFEITVFIEVGEEINFINTFGQMDLIVIQGRLHGRAGGDFSFFKFVRKRQQKDGTRGFPVKSELAQKKIGILRRKLHQQLRALLPAEGLPGLLLSLPEPEIMIHRRAAGKKKNGQAEQTSFP